MKVALWQDDKSGPAAVFIPQGADRPADSATVPGCPPAPARQWAAKGTAVSWRQWTEHLTERLPYGGQWSVQDVPDGMSARQALYHLREKAQEHGLAGTGPEK